MQQVPTDPTANQNRAFIQTMVYCIYMFMRKNPHTGEWSCSFVADNKPERAENVEGTESGNKILRSNHMISEDKGEDITLFLFQG